MELPCTTAVYVWIPDCWGQRSSVAFTAWWWAFQSPPIPHCGKQDAKICESLTPSTPFLKWVYWPQWPQSLNGAAGYRGSLPLHNRWWVQMLGRRMFMLMLCCGLPRDASGWPPLETGSWTRWAHLGLIQKGSYVLTNKPASIDFGPFPNHLRMLTKVTNALWGGRCGRERVCY